VKSVKNITDIWCGGHASFVKDTAGVVRVFGGNEFGGLGLGDNKTRLRPTENPQLAGMKIFAGGNHILIVDERSTKIYSCGYNSHGMKKKFNICYIYFKFIVHYLIFYFLNFRSIRAWKYD
jgi:alpha-tubulin suppressor-like RCC1 family protein